MGFDNECILDIQSLAGEYFCPVCRLLVLPNETLQAQCTHLYCKPCIAYTANSTRACPYDGYLVTESDAKPLAESNKALADIINKIAVHCLYHRSGCTWQGSLEECVTHCSGCAFGNSPVVCNRCALQIVHRQVQEHAQTCPGVTTQTQEATSANAAATAQSQTANPISGVSVSSQAAAQTATAVTPTQDPKQQPDPSTQAQAVPVGTEQWYQQQYHQYYQQFGGYEAYQQQYQQYYQQQAASQAQLYQQTQVQQQQPQLQTQAPLPSNPQAPPQNQSQPQPQMQQHGQPLLSIQPQDLQSQVQTVMGSQPLNQQQQIQSVVPANQQLQTQNHLAQQYTQAHLQVQQYPSQSYPQQHGQVPVYQQPQVLQLQPQGHPQQQLPPQGNLQQQQLPPHVHPQQQLLPHPQAPQGQSSQQLQAAQQQIPALNPLPQSKIPTQGVTAYQSYPPLQSHLQGQSGGSQQQNLHVRPPQTTQSIQVQGHLPQQSSQIHPPQFQQLQGLLLPQSLPNIPPAQQPNYHPNQQVGLVVPQRGVMQSVQQHMAPQIGQHQQPPLGGQHVGTTHSQFNHRGASSQLPMRPQISPQGLPHPYQSHQNILGLNNMKHSHAYQNLAGRQLLQAYGVADHSALNAPVGPQVRPMQPGYKQNSMAGSSKAPRGKNVTGQHASLPQTSAKMEKKSIATDSGQKWPERSDTDGKNPVGDHKSVSEDGKPGQSEPAGIVEEGRTINGLQASENGEASVNQTAKDDSAQRIGEQLDGKVGKISADKKDDPTSDPKVEEKAGVEDKANVEGHPQGTPVRQNDLEGQSQIGGGSVASPSNSDRNAVKDHMQRQASGFSHEGGPSQKKSAAPSLLDPSPPGPPLHQPNAPGQILNQVHPQLKQSHPPHSRMLLREHLVTGVPPDVFEAPNQRPFHFDGRQSGPNFPGATGLNGQPSDFHSNFSQRDERMIYLRDEHLKYPLPDPSRRVYDRVFDDELRNSSEHITKFESYLSSRRPFGRGPLDKAVLGPGPNPGDPASSASLRIFPHDRERRPFGPPEPNLGRLDSSRMHTDGFSSGYSSHHLNRFLPRSPGREYDGLRSRFLDLHNRYAPDIARRDLHGPDGPIGSSLPESRFPSLPGPFRKREFDENFRGEHMSGDLMGRDLFTSHIHRSELSGPGRLPNHLLMGEPGGLSSFHDRPRPGESVEHEIYGARIGEPGHKSTFPLPPYLDDAIYKGGVETFDGLRKRRTISMGWCRLCKVDCETVEGLDVHSQSREHQEMAMDMVRSIKQQNAKKQKQSSSSKSSVGNVNSDAPGNKH